jgi:hypothetical protein
MPVRGRGEPGQDVLCRVEPGGRFERAGQGPRVCDAVEPEGPFLADPRVRARDVPTARMGDEPVRVQGAFAASAVGGGVPDCGWPVVAHGIGESEQDGGPGRPATTPRSSSSASTTWTASTRNWRDSSRTLPTSPPRCPGATGHCCSVTPTATWSTSSRLSSLPPSTGSAASRRVAQAGRRRQHGGSASPTGRWSLPRSALHLRRRSRLTLNGRTQRRRAAHGAHGPARQAAVTGAWPGPRSPGRR